MRGTPSVDRPLINWAELAQQAGIVTHHTPSGGTSTNQGSEEARRALEVLIGDDNIRRGVELWLAGRAGEQAAASGAWSVLMYIRSWKASEMAYAAYRTFKDRGDADQAALAILLISDICHPGALKWVDEFLDYAPVADAALRLVDQALFHGVIYPDDDRVEPWLSRAELSSDPYLLEAVQRIRASMINPGS